MAIKSVVCTISVWDRSVRVSFIHKSLRVGGEVSLNLTVTSNDHGMHMIDPFEVTYCIRSGIQQLLSTHSVNISNICVAVMPGYLMAWDYDTCRPVTDCLCSNNSLPKDVSVI